MQIVKTARDTPTQGGRITKAGVVVVATERKQVPTSKEPKRVRRALSTGDLQSSSMVARIELIRGRVFFPLLLSSATFLFSVLFFIVVSATLRVAWGRAKNSRETWRARDNEKL